ncbi:permease prefix domain 1-containing protein [Deinococcus radiophilus]|uniref:permease prefix domain 1-containing protein n=1 Tax=Deinococcus radiophilus TaxID=32062 RepID=UPI003606069F
MTAHAGVHSAALTRYLRLATLGLLGEQRQAAQDELEEHLLTRADHLHAFGLPYDQALSQALRDMGSPARQRRNAPGAYHAKTLSAASRPWASAACCCPRRRPSPSPPRAA